MRRMRPGFAVVAAALAALFLSGRDARAWGIEGHRAIASLADRLLEQSDAAVRAKLLALLSTDSGNHLTKHDIASEATWADVLREKSEEARFATAAWHTVPLKFDSPDLVAACFGRPALAPGWPASHGRDDNCAVDKVKQFEAELRDPDTTPGERLAAVQFLLNLVGDLNDPLATIDRGDHSGQCVAVQVGATKAPVRLPTYWNKLVGDVVGRDPAHFAAQIAGELKPDDVTKWNSGTPEEWARESYEVAKNVVYGFETEKPAGKYTFPANRTEKDPCGAVDLYKPGPDYETKALAAVKEQLAKSGVRLAQVLRTSLK